MYIFNFVSKLTHQTNDYLSLKTTTKKNMFCLNMYLMINLQKLTMLNGKDNMIFEENKRETKHIVCN